jgi:hypothetical protein
MDETKQKIITLFKERGDDISTGDILVRVYPESKQLKEKEDDTSKRAVAQLHRKLLYHINELLNDGILRFSRFGEKGLKFFALNVLEGEEITELTPRYKKKVTISRPIMPAMPIESYEHQGIIIKYEPNSWIDKLNSLVIASDKITSVKELESVFTNAVSLVNDCICLNNFNKFLEKINKMEAVEILEKINSECENFGKKVSCIIDIAKIDRDKLLHIINNITEPNMKNLLFIYNLDSEELQEQFGLFKEIVGLYTLKRRTLYIKNKRVQKAPYFLGTAGVYCISEKEWQTREIKDCLSIACGQSSLIVDVEKFYSVYGLDNIKFSELMLNVSRSFLSANSMQRRKSQEYFKSMISLDKKNEKEFLEFSRNYIRFWNYGLLQPGIDSKLVINMINEARKKVDQFATAEETIYKSCGMPTRFKIALSCAFKEASENLSSAKYARMEIMNLDDLYKPKVKKEIVEKENVTSMFDGGNDVTFHRTGMFEAEDILREISVIMNTYKMPLFSYSFGGLKGDMKITSYF